LEDIATVYVDTSATVYVYTSAKAFIICITYPGCTRFTFSQELPGMWAKD